MECSICLQSIREEKHCIKTLSCGHMFHSKCYINLILSHGNIFIKCPLCRETNVCRKLFHDDPFLDLKEICCNQRCNHKTKEGKRCKKNSFIFNNGCCKIHKKNYLLEDRYSLMRDFILWIFMTGNKKHTKLIMIDIAKKLLIQYREIHTIQDIHYFFHKFYHLNTIKKGEVIQWNRFYQYYELEELDKDWLNNCMKYNVIY